MVALDCVTSAGLRDSKHTTPLPEQRDPEGPRGPERLWAMGQGSPPGIVSLCPLGPLVPLVPPVLAVLW